jgi:uncharacterized membrane protein
MIVKRIIGIIVLIVMGYVAYIKINQNVGDSDYAAFYLFLIVVVLFLFFLAIKKILTY